MYLLDTNICIYLMKGKYPALQEKILSLRPDDICISAITVYELEYRAAKADGAAAQGRKCAYFLPHSILFLLRTRIPKRQVQ